MSESRTIKLNINAVEMTELHAATDAAQVFAAIGYLSTWNMTFPHLTIFKDGKTDLVAAYRKEDGTQGYVIGAVWNATTGKFGFHS